MGLELGRVSGNLLSSNLLRNGENLAFDTELLYLDVATGKIGINTDMPSRELLINDTIRSSNVLVDTQLDIGNFNITTNVIQHVTGSIFLYPAQVDNPVINVIGGLNTANLSLVNNSIINIIIDDDINLSPIGDVVDITSINTLVNGDLHATGDVTWDGDVILGDDNTDGIIFNAYVKSAIIPTVDDVYDLGALTATWRKLISVNAIGNSLVSNTAVVNNIDLLLVPGSTIYVSVSGDDTNQGTHLHATYRTIKHALSMATVGDEIVILPGIYSEIFPLIVPVGVSVKGTSIRSVIIRPIVSTNHCDAFLLNSGTTISFLTIQDFFYNAITNVGYAFRLAPGYIAGGSSYVYNVTVITRGSVTSVDDPYGFDSGDAGGGAYLDGSVVNIISAEPLVLFYSVTFIVPNQTGIMVTNGVSVEWVNSFTYYASRGIYLITGVLGLASQGLKCGASLIGINSANIYGTYGIIAEGVSTIARLSSHNFGFIGSGKISTDDESLVIQANEVVAIDAGIIYYESVDQLGDYRIGDIFFVDQSTGSVSLNAQSIGFTANGSIVIEGISGVTSIYDHAVQTGNIRIHQNTIDSLIGPVNLLASTNVTTFTTDVIITGLINLSGDMIVDGDVHIGDSPFDVLTIVPTLSQTISPNANNLYTLGTDLKIWRTAFLTSLLIDNQIQITANTITTLTVDTDLQLLASGVGKIQISSTDVTLMHDLTVEKYSTVSDVAISGDVLQIGDVLLTGFSRRTGSAEIIGNLTITNDVSFADVKISSNKLITTFANANLLFTASGIGRISIPSNDVIIDTNIINYGNSYFTNVEVPTVTALTLVTTDITIDNNIILTNGTNHDLLIGANNLGKISVPANDINVSNDLTVVGVMRLAGISSLLDTEIIGSLTVLGNVTAVGAIDIIGRFANHNISIIGNSAYLSIPSIKIQASAISISAIDTDLLIDTGGNGAIVLDQRLTIIGQEIKNRWIAATTDEQKSIILASNNGNVVIDATNFLTIPHTDIASLNLTDAGAIRYNHHNNIYEGYTVAGIVSFTDIYSTDKLTHITAELSPGIADNILRFSINGTLKVSITNEVLVANSLMIDDISIVNNTISNNVTSHDLEFMPDGIGEININGLLIHDTTVTNYADCALIINSTEHGYVKFGGSSAVMFPYGTESERRDLPELGETRYNTTSEFMEIFNGNAWQLVVATNLATLTEIEDELNLWSMLLG